METSTILRITGLATVLADLDRCAHGRHEGDHCAGWSTDTPAAGCQGGRSLGNPLFGTGTRLGTGVHGGPIIVPPRGHRHLPDAWRWPPAATTTHLTLADRQVWRWLAQHPEGATPTAVADACQLSTADVADTLRLLEANGRATSHDGVYRINPPTPTPAGSDE